QQRVFASPGEEERAEPPLEENLPCTDLTDKAALTVCPSEGNLTPEIPLSSPDVSSP
ncbi:hypothetical protein M9458_010780, partial [Cirrhinus mrigala]